MDHKHLLDFCRKQAKKFRRPDLYEDLVQEGYLAALEKASGGVDNLGTLTWSASRAMMDFISLKQRPVSIPASEVTRKNAAAIRRGEETPVTPNTSQSTFDSLRMALEGGTEAATGDERATEDPTEFVVFMRQLDRIMKEKLSHKDYKIFQMIFGAEQLTIREVSEVLGMTVRNVRYRRDNIERKLGMLKSSFLLK